MLTMRLLLTCECVCIAQVESKLSSFVAALSEVSSVTDPIHGPDSSGVGETEISSLTDPTYESFVAAVSEVSSVTDPTYGPDSAGADETQVSSLTDPTYRPSSRGESNAGVDRGELAVADAAVVSQGADSSTPVWPRPNTELVFTNMPVGDGVDGGAGGGSQSGTSPGAQVLPNADGPPPAWVPGNGGGADGDSSSWTWDFVRDSGPGSALESARESESGVSSGTWTWSYEEEPQSRQPAQR